MIPHSHNTTPNAPGLIAPRLGIVVAIIIGLTGLTFLIPNRDQLLSRFISDGDANAAGHLLGTRDQDSPAAVSKTLTTELLTLCQRSDWNRSTVSILENFLRQHDDCINAADVVLANIETIPTRERNILFTAIIERSLAEGDLPRAVSTQSLLLSRTATLTPELVRQAVTTFRYNGEAGRALDLINRLQDQAADLPEDLRELRVTLARETSQPQVAFNLLAIKIRATKNPAELKKLIPDAIQIGIEAGQLEQLIPLYLRYIATFRATDDPRVRDYSHRLAQTYEWIGDANKAFEAYLTLAKTGDREALDRCISLNVGLFRTAELLDTLLAADALVKSDDKLLSLTAKLLADAARREEAIALYNLYLEHCPDDAEAHFLLGLVHDGLLDFGPAVTHLTIAHQLDPENVNYLYRLARLCISAGQFEVALTHYRNLIEISDDPEHAKRYNALAFSLDDTENLKIALARLLELKPGATFATALANIYREEGNFSQAIAILNDTLNRTDEEVPLRLELAQLESNQKRHDLALQILAPLSLSKYPDALPLVVSALSSLPSTPSAAKLPAFLRTYGAALEHSSALPTDYIIDLANLELRYGSPARGQSLMRRALRECSKPSHLAQAHYGLGNPGAALPQQLAYIKEASRPVSEDYHFLGDIYTALGQSSNASSAYNYAVVLLKKKLTRTPR